MDALGPWHLLIIAVIFFALFGAKRLPEAARSLGTSARILKRELKERDDAPEGATVVTTETVATPLATPVVPVATPVAAPAPTPVPPVR